MPPQEIPHGSGPAVWQPPVQTKETKSKEVDTKSAEPPKQDPETAAKNAAAAKQHAAGTKHQETSRAQIVKNQLDQRLMEKNAAKTDRAPTTPKPEHRKSSANQSGAWAFVKEAASIASKAAATGVETIRETTTNASAIHVAEKANAHIKGGFEKTQQIASTHEVTQGVAKLHQREYRQDLVKGEYYEVEKITPGTTDKTKTKERVEDRTNGDVASRHYHLEKHRTSTQTGLEDRLKELNQNKELTPFEKGLVSKWDPQKKEGSITGLSPIIGTDSTGKGSTEVQAYKIERGLETTYYDRNGNNIEPESRQQKIEKLDRRQHPQDMVRGELFVAENITPGSVNKTTTREHADDLNAHDIIHHNLHPSQSRTSNQPGLEDRLKELNQGKDLTPFEKGMVSEWGMKYKRDKDPITNLSPIMGVDTSGKKGPNELEAYKVQRGVETTYYDRNGNVLKDRWSRGAGQAIPTDSPIDYVSDAKIAKDLIMGAGEKIVEKFAKETTSITTKVEKGAIVNSVDEQFMKNETEAVSMAGEQSVKAEARTVQKQVASETERAGVTNHYTTWRQGSGTTVHAEFTELEEKTIKGFQKDGMSRQEAEDVIRITRGEENIIKVLKPDGPNAVGSTRRADWANPGAGKKKP